MYPVTFCHGFNLTILPNGDNYHIASLDSLGQAVFWTSGSFDVISLAGCSAGILFTLFLFFNWLIMPFYIAGKVFYHATPTIDAANPIGATLQHIFTIDVTSREIKQVNQGEGVFSASSFSPAGNYFIAKYLGPYIPKVFLLSTDLTVNVTLESNSMYPLLLSFHIWQVCKLTRALATRRSSSTTISPIRSSPQSRELPVTCWMHTTKDPLILTTALTHSSLMCMVAQDHKKYSKSTDAVRILCLFLFFLSLSFFVLKKTNIECRRIGYLVGSERLRRCRHWWSRNW